MARDHKTAILSSLKLTALTPPFTIAMVGTTRLASAFWMQKAGQVPTPNAASLGVHLPRRYSFLKTEKTVFVVDDDPSLLRGMKRVLKQHGFQAVLFNSAKELRLHNNFEQAFCIVLDIDLGDESGITLRQELSTTGITLPVIYMTGKDDTTVRTAALASGCVAYLTKPFSGKSLIEPIQRVWNCLA